MEAVLSNGGPWALAAGLVSIHAWFLTRPVVKLWRECEADKRVLRDEHAELRAELVALGDKVNQLENGGSHE